MTAAQGVILGAGSVFVLGILIAGVVAFLRDRRESILSDARIDATGRYVSHRRHDDLADWVQTIELRLHRIAEDAAS
jgi:hypothetical protein